MVLAPRPLHFSVVLLGLLSRLAFSQDVLVATDEDYAELLKSNERLVVKYYAPWCGHCKALAPEYDKAAVLLSDMGLKTKLMKVDCTVEKKVCKDNSIESYPTVVLYVNGKPEDYVEGRDADTMVRWLKKREGVGFEVIEAADVEKYLGRLKEGGFAALARVTKGSVRAKAFSRAASKKELADHEASNLQLAMVYLSEGADPKNDSTLTMYRPGFEKMGEAAEVVMTGSWLQEKIVHWVLDQTYPLVGRKFASLKYSASAVQKFGLDGVVAAVVSGFDEEDDLRRQVLSIFADAAKAYPKWKFVVTPASELSAEDEEELVSDGDEVITALIGKKKYRLKNFTDGERADEKQVSQFLQQLKAGKLKPHYKTAVPPENPLGEDNVLTVTGSTFEKYVLDPKKDVFVMFHSPHCGHCQAMAPEWSLLGQKVGDEGLDKLGVVIAKFDGIDNECDEEITGFPKLVLYPAVKKSLKMQMKMNYPGAREADQLFDYLKLVAKNLEDYEPPTAKKSFDMARRELQGKKRRRRSGKSEL